MGFAFSFFVALLASSVCIKLLMENTVADRFADAPDGGRKQHNKAISRVGGVGIFVSTMLAVLLALGGNIPDAQLLVAASIVALFGMADDAKNLNYKWKFAGQIMAVLLAIEGGVVIEQMPFCGLEPVAEPVAIFITFFFLLGVTNAVNLSDGLDGLAGGSAFLSLCVVAILSYIVGNYSITILACAMLGAVVGFLRYNTHPAVLFMGDTGSQFLGFMLACLAVLATQGESIAYSPLLPLLIVGLPILDTAYVILARVRLGRSPFSADRKHLHYQIMTLGFHHHESVAIIYLLQTTLVASAYLMRYQTDASIFIFYLLFCASFVGVLLWARFSGWKFRANKKQASDRRNPFFHAISRYYNCITTILAATVLFSFAVAAFIFQPLATSTSSALPYLAACILVLLMAVSPAKQSDWVLRSLTSLTAVLLFILIAPLAGDSNQRLLMDASLLFTVALLMLCFRISRKELFSLNNQDLLVLCLFMVLAVLQIDRDTIYLFIRIVLVIYILEYLIAVQRPKRHLILVGNAVMLAIAGLRLSGLLA